MSENLKKVSKDETGAPASVVKEEVKTPDNEYAVEIIRDYYGSIDPFYLPQRDPNYVYRFLRDDHKNLSIKTSNLLFQKGGWQICPKEHLLKIGIKDKEFAPDGLLRRGDCILAFMPKKLFDEKEQIKIKRANEPISMIKRLVKEGNPDVGGKEMHESMKGIQTAKELKM